jgi:hypothetical protein
MRKHANGIIELLLVILFPSLNVFLRDIWRQMAQSHLFPMGLQRLGLLRDRTWGLRSRVLRRP